MLENVLAFLEEQQNSKFQIIGKVEDLMNSTSKSEPELPYHIREKENFEIS